MQKTTGGVTAAKGFLAASAAAHIKYANRDDMAMIFSEAPCTAAGTFTSNVVKASPVLWDRGIVESKQPVRAVVVNAGIANACTGEQGYAYCHETAQEAAGALGIKADEVLLGSTGVIGMQLPMDRIKNGVHLLAGKLAHTAEAGTLAARAIMTTDTVKKEFAGTFEVHAKQPAAGADSSSGSTKTGSSADASGMVTVTIGGMSKGSGMIHPNMCTMLGYITTDLAISKELLDKAVHAVVPDTFNMISVDGDTSTNDTLLCLANGLAGNEMITEENEDYRAFEAALRSICTDLARTMAGDGEGASKRIDARVLNADTTKDAKILAKSVICSSLTKAAIFGKDANWGRILCALGYAGVAFDPDKTDLWFMDAAAGEQLSALLEDRRQKEADGLAPFDLQLITAGRKMLIFTNGSAAEYSEEEATAMLSGDVVTIVCDMHAGTASATAWGCDLTYDYVKINADYRS
jgi:glutamate N-acetyltransferase/amino-acid N-acetyltransferase